MARKPEGPLRRGWTTGACATAATKAALTALVTGTFPDPVTTTLPKGETPAFPLAREHLARDWAEAGIVKDAGDDPDVTHGALVLAKVSVGLPGSGVVFRAGEGVGMVTKPGLPIPPGEPAINPVPRQLMSGVVDEISQSLGGPHDVVIEISVEGGEALAQKTWNPRLGIVGGLSILEPLVSSTHFPVPPGYIPFIAGSMWRRRPGCPTSRAVRDRRPRGGRRAPDDLPEIAFLDMGDFAGGC